MVASGASIKLGEPGEAHHREPLDAADVPKRSPFLGRSRRQRCSATQSVSPMCRGAQCAGLGVPVGHGLSS
jgi:hypothetical protein